MAAVALAVIAVASLAPAPNARAHANMLRASPAPDEQLDAPPERIIIWYSEPVEPRFSQISILNAAGAELGIGDTRFDPSEPQAMWRALPRLEHGTYTVVWRNISTIDGHRVVGSYLFAVGEPVGIGASVEVAEQPIVSSLFDPFIRWTYYVSVAAVVGGLVFELFVVSPLLNSTAVTSANGAASASLTARVRRVSRIAGRMMLAFAAALMLAQAVQLVNHAAVISEGTGATVATTIGDLPDVATGSAWGVNWMLRTAAALAALVLLAIAHRSRTTSTDGDGTDTAIAPDAPDQLEDLDDDDSTDFGNILTTDSLFGALALAAGIAYLVFVSLASHNATAPTDIRWAAIAGDLVHIITAAVWAGGLIYLLTAILTILRAETVGDAWRFIGRMAHRFTSLAFVSAAALFASGLLAMLVQVAVPDAIATPYGRIVIAKIALTIPLTALALFNMRSVAQRLDDARTALAGTLRWTVGAEVAIAVAALLAAGWLASIEPARQYAERHGIGIEEASSLQELIDGAIIEATIEPGGVGRNTLTVSVTDSSGAPYPHVEQVRGRVRFLDADFGEPVLPMEPTDDGIWTSEVLLSIGGAYQVETRVVRTDAFDSSLAFRFSARSTTVATDQLRASFAQTSALFGLVLAAIGGALIFTRALRSETPGLLDIPAMVRHPGIFGVAGAVAVAIGILVALNPATVGLGAPQDVDQNPWAPTQQSVAMGSASYATSCASCHGASGRGDGDAGKTLNPPPSDLAVHVPLHTDGELWSFIANGIEGTAMVPRLGELSADEIWHIVNYIRTVEE